MSSTQKSTVKYSAGYELNVSRGVRLKFVALQMPLMLRFLRKFSTKFNKIQLNLKFKKWKDVYFVWKQEQLAVLNIHAKAAVPIQSIVRGFISRRHVAKLKSNVIKEIDEKKRWSMYQMQCFARIWVLKYRALKRSGARSMLKKNMAAIMVQKSFRGWLSRVHAIELEKLKVLRQLRKWSHGVSHHLVNMKEMKSGYSQSVLCQAIAITTLTSRPLRNLPPLSYVRTVRQSLYVLYWRLQTHFSAMRAEFLLRQKERRGMYLQDLFSGLVEMKLLGDRKKLLALQKEYEERLAREALEEQRRQAAAAHMLLSDFQHRQAVTARANAEISLQNVYKAKLARIAEAKKLVDDVEREGVLMRVEEVLSKTCAEKMAQYEEMRVMLEQEERRVEQAKLAGIAMYGEKASLSKTILSTQLQRLVPRIAKQPKHAAPPNAGELGVEKYRERQWTCFLESVRRFGSYLRSLPVNEVYIREVCEALAASHKEAEFPGFPSSSSTVSKQRKAFALEHTSTVAVEHTMEEAFLNRQLEEAVFGVVMQPLRTLSALTPVHVDASVQINGMLSRPQLVQLLGPQIGQHLSIAQPQYTMSLQCSLAVDADAVSKMRFLLQLRKHRAVRVKGYKHLITQHVAFKQALAALHRKRKEIHTAKYVTRQLRKAALQEATVLERGVLQLRDSLVELCSSFYRSFFEEVELFLCLFYPVEVKSEDTHSLDDDATADKIISKKGLFNSSNAGSVSYHATSDADRTVREGSLLALQQQQHAAALHTAKASPNPGRRGRKSSRIDAVYIAPKRSNLSAVAQTSKSFKNKRESVVYGGSGSIKKAHVLDPYHALHKLPVNTTLQHKLTSPPRPLDRLHMYEDYWATLHLDIQYYQVSPADIASLPTAPIPTFHHDGKPHILKYSQTGASKRINASHVHKHFDSGTMNIQEKLKLKEAQLKHQKMMKKEVKLHDIPGFNLFQDTDDQEYDFSVWTEKVVIWARQVARWFRHRERSWRRHHRAQALTYLLRLQYLVDSSASSSQQGEQQQQHMKASNMLVRRKLLARLQEQEQKRGDRKAANSLSSMNENDPDFVERLHELNSLFLLRHLDQADVLDVFEVLLCKSNFGLKVSGAESKEIFQKKSVPPESKNIQGTKRGKAKSAGGPGVATHTAALSRLVTADELDVTVAKHPASLVARFLLVQQALLQESAVYCGCSAENALDLLRISCQNVLLFGTLFCPTDGDDHSTQMGRTVAPTTSAPAPSKQAHKKAAPTETDLYLSEGIFHACHPSLLLLASLQREVGEMRDIITQLLRDRCLSLQLTPPSATVASGGKSAQPNPAASHSTLIPITVEDFLMQLQYTKIRPVQYIQCEKTYEAWRYRFPSWMHPIVYFGSSAPKETFFRRLQYELRNGKGGIYARIDALDSRLDAAGRKLLRFLRQAVVLRRFVRNKCSEAYRGSADRCLMQWEDTLAAAVRVDQEARRVKEEQEKYTKKGFLRKLFSCFRHTATFRRSARVVHSLSPGEDHTFDHLEESQVNIAAPAPQPSGKFNGFGWGFRPKYAKILVFTSEDELSAALRAGLEQSLPVQVYSAIEHRKLEHTIMTALLQEICTVESNSMVESAKTKVNLQALVAEYALLDSARDCYDAVLRAVQARSEVSSCSHRRQYSWITGQEVHINQHGQHIAEAQCCTKSLRQAAKLYEALSATAAQTVVRDANTMDMHNVPSVPESLTSKLPMLGTKNENTAQSVKFRIQAEQLNMFTAAAQPVKEVYLGGGLRHLISVLRVVEDAPLNPRGIASLHSLLLPHLEPQLPTMAQFQGTLNNTGCVEAMKKSIGDHRRSTGAGGGKIKTKAVSVRDGQKVVRLGSADTAKKPPKTAAEAGKTITKFILERSSSAKKLAATGKPLLKDVATNSSSAVDTAVVVTETAISAGDTKIIVPANSGNQPQPSLLKTATGSVRASSSSQRNYTAKSLNAPVGSANSSVKVRRASVTRPSSSCKPSEETARDTITKFLLSRAFNLSVSKRSKKYNYNGTRTRTEVRVRGLKTEVFAGKKIVRFMRARTKSRLLQLEEEKKKAVAAAAAEKVRREAEALRAEAQRSEQQKDTAAVYCTSLFDLFTSARAGYSDRPLCQDRMWQFATVITNKSRKLCNGSIKMLRSHTEHPVKALPTLHDLRSVLVVALFRERHLFATQTVPKKTSFLTNSTTNQPILLQSFSNTIGKRETVRRCAEVIQGACRIFLSRKIVATRRQERLQQCQTVQQ